MGADAKEGKRMTAEALIVGGVVAAWLGITLATQPRKPKRKGTW